MPNMLPRLLYILAALAWFLLLRPNPVTIVMAGCFACLTLPVYRRMRCTIRHWRKRLRLRHPGRLGHIVISCSHRLPLYGYIVMIFSAVVIPISTLVLLVSPQVAGGLARLRELQANNFQLPPEWVMRFQELRHSLADYPKVDKMISEFLSNLDAMLADTMGLLINRSVDVLGGTKPSEGLSDVHFLRLTLKDKDGKIVSTNSYWRGNERTNFNALEQLPGVKLDVSSKLTRNDNGEATIQATIGLPKSAKSVAFGVRVQAVRASDGERLLPALMDDNYFTLMPGEKKNVRITFDESLLQGSKYKLIVRPYNSAD